MKNNKKRGFTIVELVIVIAVIAILAAVLIPTFSNVITKANESKALQQARNAWYDYVATLSTADIQKLGTISGTITYELDNTTYYFKLVKGSFTAEKATAATTTTGEYAFEIENGAIKGAGELPAAHS